ncbi:four-carbon acid sugar kinase family protein [Telmatospirillum sp. J64-1]|uniref:four-carbon acid sugar kinase family protein n=1 Tax=Telmatospirillum sp. J64-1 TaxID=2502183 RepID=UPI00163D7441|nr:four-carbon acid sugar kinase family protein [Telmatospirillum sp. J64-1]
MVKLLIVADDLTGALDSSVPFAERGLRVLVALRPDGIAEAMRQEPDILAVSTGSREASPEAARGSVEAVLSQLPGIQPGLLFKKIDSRLKGRLREEMEPFVALGFEQAVISPAIPGLGRYVQDGHLVGAGVDRPISVQAAFGALGCRMIVEDVGSDEDLDALAAREGRNILFVGARGLASAMARRMLPSGVARRPDIQAPLLFAIGSRDPITLRQVERLRSITGPGMKFHEAPNGNIMGINGLGRDSRVIQIAPAELQEAGDIVGARFGKEVARLVAAEPGRALFACGGETAHTVLSELGVGILEVQGEVFPGVPVSSFRLQGQAGQVITKSGGFGSEMILVDLVQLAGMRQLSLQGAIKQGME